MRNYNRYKVTPQVLTPEEVISEDSVDQVNNKKVTFATQLDPNNDGVQAFPFQTTNTRITTATTTVISTVPCWIRISVEGGTMGKVEVFNNTVASGSLKFDQTPAAKDTIPYGGPRWLFCSVGATIRTTAATVLLVEALTI